jgi:putative N-acetyltransferase (TIGR04045 family)
MKICEIRVAESEEEIQKALELRRMVFVDEQHMFEEDDLDEYDNGAIYLNAWLRGKDVLIGTVRCYRDKEKPDVWWGGRLAVHPDYRTRGIGVYLIRAAIETVKNQQASRFLASVQLQNIELFKKLGWEPIGDTFIFHGRPHQMMEVDLHVFHASPQSAGRRQQAMGT